MNVTVKKIERGRVVVTVELSPAEYEPFLHKAAETISQQTSIPGFRPGRASLEVVKQRVGEDQLWQEALEPAIRRTLIAALDQEKLLTVGAPQVEVQKLSAGNPVVYQATIGLLPAVTIGEYQTITVKSQPINVGDDQVKRTLDDLQKSRATEARVTRPAKTGDKVEIDFELFKDNVPVQQGSQTKFPLVIGEGNFIPGFEDQLVGLAARQTKEFSLTFPKNYSQQQLAGAVGTFKVTMQAVYELTPPALDDAFAQGLGDFKTIAELKTKIHDNLAAEAQNREQQRLETELLDRLIEASSFDEIPDVLIDSEAKKMVEELEHNLSHQSLRFDDYLGHLKKKREDLLLDFAPQAIKRVKSALVSRAIAQREHLTASDAEVDAEINQTVKAYGNSPKVRKQIESDDYRAYVGNVLTARKVIEHLKAIMVE